MPELSCIIVEDEPLAVRVLKDYIAQVSYLTFKASFGNAIEAGNYLNDHPADLIFLDVHLPMLKGLSFLKTLQNPPHIIVTTAYHQYAVESFALNVTDYLLKPFDFERFLQAVNKVRKLQHSEAETELSKPKQDHLFVTVNKRNVRILFSEIKYIESQKEYIRIATTCEEYRVRMGINEVESLLPARLFMRIHRSFIISTSRIKSFTAEEVEIDGILIPVGRSYRDSIRRL